MKKTGKIRRLLSMVFLIPAMMASGCTSASSSDPSVSVSSPSSSGSAAISQSNAVSPVSLTSLAPTRPAILWTTPLQPQTLGVTGQLSQDVSAYTVSPQSVVGETFYLQFLYQGMGILLPTVREYAVDLKTDTLTLLKERDPSLNQRVLDFYQKDGHLVENIIGPGPDEQLLLQTVIDDQAVLSLPLAGAWGVMSVSGFAHIQGETFFVAAVQENGQSWIRLYRVEGAAGVAEAPVSCLYEVALDENANTGGLSRGLIPAAMKANTDSLVFCVMNGAQPQLVLYQNGAVSEIPISAVPFQIVPVENGALTMHYLNDDTTQEVWQFISYVDGQELPVEISPQGTSIRTPGGMNGSTFFFTDASSVPCIATLEGSVIQSKMLDQIPAGLDQFFLTGDGQIFVFAEIYGDAASGKDIQMILLSPQPEN